MEHISISLAAPPRKSPRLRPTRSKTRRQAEYAYEKVSKKMTFTTWLLRSVEKLWNLHRATFSVEIRKICARGRKGSVVPQNGEPSQKTKGLGFGIIAAVEVEGKDGR